MTSEANAIGMPMASAAGSKPATNHSAVSAAMPPPTAR